MPAQPFVSILMGSSSDKPVMMETKKILDELGVPNEMKVRSAHRTPVETKAYIKDAEQRGCAVFIAAAGLAAHLAGAVAAATTRPVIGVPMDVGPLNGMDALLSTVQMPGGIPVASMAIGKAGAKNAGFFAAQILAVQNNVIGDKITEQRARARALILEDS